jgi:hypothetical protein
LNLSNTAHSFTYEPGNLFDVKIQLIDILALLLPMETISAFPISTAIIVLIAFAVPAT